MTEPARELLTAGQVAAAFMVNAKTITRWARAGRLPFTLTGGGHRRFDPAEVEALRKERGMPAGGAAAIRALADDDGAPVRLLLAAEVAALFRVHMTTAAKWDRRGVITAIRTPGGRRCFREDAVRRWLGPAWTGDGLPELLTIPEVAAAWQVSVMTATRWAQSGKLPVIRTPAGHMRLIAAAALAGLQAAGDREGRPGGHE